MLDNFSNSSMCTQISEITAFNFHTKESLYGRLYCSQKALKSSSKCGHAINYYTAEVYKAWIKPDPSLETSSQVFKF